MYCSDSREKPICGWIFSKNRAMQLEATLRSFYLHCQDSKEIAMSVLFLATDTTHETQYRQLAEEYPLVNFIKESNFREQVLAGIKDLVYVLFLVDDNIFVQNFCLNNLIEVLEDNQDALGFSLRLGKNVDYCYTIDCAQETPEFFEISQNVLKYDWTKAQYDFGYPLEVSSSIYRTADIHSLLNQIPFTNPNIMEAYMQSFKTFFVNSKRHLLCFQQSVTFCNPINVVQDIFRNRSGKDEVYSVESLTELFTKGYRIDINNLTGIIPNACHQEVKLNFIKSS